MSKRAEDPLIPEIRIALMPGRFVRWNEVSDMVSNLDRVQERVEALVEAGEAKRAVQLYEIFLSGVYAMGDFISLCVKVKAWDRLARRIHLAKPNELEAQSHYCTEPAAEGLAKRDPLAAAKLYSALGLRIVNAGKSKYYREALEHFEKCRDVYCAAGQPEGWSAVVQYVRTAHSRKSGFVLAFEKIISGKSGRLPSFAEQAQERWKRLTA